MSETSTEIQVPASEQRENIAHESAVVEIEVIKPTPKVKFWSRIVGAAKSFILAEEPSPNPALKDPVKIRQALDQARAEKDAFVPSEHDRVSVTGENKTQKDLENRVERLKELVH